VAQGLGEAICERILFDADGQLLTGSFMDYAMPRAGDLPPITTLDGGVPTRANALGAKGAGEAGAVGAPAALVGAAVDALAVPGLRHLDMPLTAEAIWRALRNMTTTTPTGQENRHA
jgi:carbon-monoxide dehydrogenase large subunit